MIPLAHHTRRPFTESARRIMPWLKRKTLYWTYAAWRRNEQSEASSPRSTGRTLSPGAAGSSVSLNEPPHSVSIARCALNVSSVAAALAIVSTSENTLANLRSGLSSDERVPYLR